MIDLAPYQFIIFDKDGTLIDFDAMWGGWVEALAARLEAASQRTLAPALFQAMDYDGAAHHTLAGGQLAVTPMADLYVLTIGCLVGQGLSEANASALVRDTWFIPDPVASARPVTDLPHLFNCLRQQGLQIAVATSDDRAPTLATLTNFGVAQHVTCVVAADDGVPLKPAPDMVWAACRAAGVAPSQAVVVGDALPELHMARASGAGLSVGVTNGVSTAADLAPFADVILPSVRCLIE